MEGQHKRPVAWAGIERSPGGAAGSPTASYWADAGVLADQAIVAAAASESVGGLGCGAVLAVGEHGSGVKPLGGPGSAVVVNGSSAAGSADGPARPESERDSSGLKESECVEQCEEHLKCWDWCKAHCAGS